MTKYSVYVQTSTKQLKKISFDIGNGNVEDKFSLVELDNYFTGTNSFDEFLKNKVDVNPVKCFISISSDEKDINNRDNDGNHKIILNAKPIILNNPFFKKAVTSYIEAKKKNPKNEVIPTSESINKFTNEIRKLAIQDNTALYNMNVNRSFPQYVYKLLLQYKKLLNNEDYSMKQEDIKDLKNQIDYNIRKYNYFRTIYLWKESYEKRKNRDWNYDLSLLDLLNKQETNADFEQSIIEDEQSKKDEPTMVEKHISVEEYLTKQDYEDVYKFLQEIKDKSHFEITDPKIDYYFKQGGLSAVLENCDLDEIDRLSKEEKEYIGFKTKGR